MWNISSFGFWTSRVVWFTGCMGFLRSCFLKQPVSPSLLLHENSRFHSRKGPYPLCCDRFPCCCVQQPAKVCILQSRLRTRASDFWISSHPAFRFPCSYKYPKSFGCNRTFCGWGTCRKMWRQVIAADFDFATLVSSPFCSCILFAIVSGRLVKLEFLAQQEELKTLMLDNWRRLFHSSRVKLPLVKMSARWCVVSNVSSLNFSIKIIPVTHPKQLCGFLTHVSWLDFGLSFPFNYGFTVLKDIQHSIGTRMCSVWWNVINVDQAWLEFVHACFVDDLPTSFPVALLHLWFCWFGSVKNEILQSLNPKDQVRVYRPSSFLHRKKWFLTLVNCAKLKFVSCTSTWLERTWGFQKCTMLPLM